jgi:hypothetical protein
LFLIDDIESQAPDLESPQHDSIKPLQSALEKQHRYRDSIDMESLKRKLSTTRRPETVNRNFLPELNQYKQNTVALQYVDSSYIA